MQPIFGLTYSLPAGLELSLKAVLEDWNRQGKMKRLWAKDATVWTGKDEQQWLGWLEVLQNKAAHLQELSAFAQEVKKQEFTHVVLLGMGGSSLCPEVLSVTFGSAPGFPKMEVLDSTDPAQIKTVENKVDLAHTLVLVASKSGSTLEPNTFKQYFFQRMQQTVGEVNAGGNFAAITDPGSKMQQVAEADKFQRVFFGDPHIGGRFSALSNFGLVPAAVLGMDLSKFLDRTSLMISTCGPETAAENNPGVVLGALLGVLGSSGRDKITLFTSKSIHDLGAWLEQLLAESTGKLGKGLIPVDGEKPAAPAAYGSDRVFVYINLASDAPAETDLEKTVADLEKAGQPVLRITLADIYNLGQEFFRWEFATAVAGSLLNINPFDQPDVEASKIATRALTNQYEQNGALAAEEPFLEENGIKLFSDTANIQALTAGHKSTVTAVLKMLFNQIKAGDYFALLAYIERNQTNDAPLQAMRHALRDAKKIATCLGYGPRFLHSTGQAYKGGPNSGVFLQITCDDAVDFPVPGQKYTFGVIKTAQARGDFQVLTERHRRALRVHLGKDLAAGLKKLNELVVQALK